MAPRILNNDRWLYQEATPCYLCSRAPRARSVGRSGYVGWLVGWQRRQWWIFWNGGRVHSRKLFEFEWITLDECVPQNRAGKTWNEGTRREEKEHGKLHKNHPKMSPIRRGKMHAQQLYKILKIYTHTLTVEWKSKEEKSNRRWNFVLTHDFNGMWFIVSNPKFCHHSNAFETSVVEL